MEGVGGWGGREGVCWDGGGWGGKGLAVVARGVCGGDAG